MKAYDKQNSYLSGLITVLPVQGRQARKYNGKQFVSSYLFRLRVQDVDKEVFYG